MRGARWRVRLLASSFGAVAIACGAGDPPRVAVTAVPPAAASAALAESRFEVRNGGGRTLLLDGVAPACGCRVASALPPSLAPGASTSLAVLCRALGPGNAARALHLWSSDPASPDTAIHVEVGAGVATAEPAALYFGYVPVGAAVTRDVALPAGAAEGSSPPADAAFSFEPLPRRADGRGAIRVRFAPRIAGVATTSLDLGSAIARLPVSGVGHGSVVAFPAEVHLPATGSGALPAITVKAVGDAPIDAPRVEYPPGVAGELRTLTPGWHFRVTLRARGAAESGGTIRIHTTALDAPELVVPVLPANEGAAS